MRGPTGPVLSVAPNFHSPTGLTPVVLAARAEGWPHVLFRGRDVGRRVDALRRRAGTAAVVHWHANLAHHPRLRAEAERLRGRVPQVATVHHLLPGEEDKVAALEGLVDRIHVPSADTEAAVRALTAVEVVRAPYLVAVGPAGGPRRPSPAGRLVVGWCGSHADLDGRKRLGVLVAAVAAARAGGADVRLRLQGEVGADAVDRARRLGVPLAVGRWRRRDQVGSFYRDLDAYASPSAVEGGPLPVLEAAVAGVPVATTEVGMAADLVAAGGARSLPVDDPEGQAAVLLALAAAGPDERREEGAAGRRAATTLAGPGAAAAHDALHSALAGGPPPPAPAGLRRANAEELRRDRVHEGHELRRRGRPVAAALAVASELPGLPRGDRRWAVSRLLGAH